MEIQHFDVWRDGHPVLTFSSAPGRLVSSALPEPGAGAPEHAFVTAQALDAAFEGELGRLLRSARSLDELIELLERDGFEVRPAEDTAS